jgi:hypothetical protein
MFRTQVFLLVAILAGLAHAQAPQKRIPKWQPTPYEFVVENEAYRVNVAELIRDGVLEVKGKMLVRRMEVTYHVATSDLAEDRTMAILLGASPEDAAKINRVAYMGASWAKAPKMRYVKVSYYAGDRLVATQDVGQVTADDAYNVKAARIYTFARALYEQERKENKAG